MFPLLCFPTKFYYRMAELLMTLHFTNNLKTITERLKASTDFSWFCNLLEEASPTQLLYLSEPLTECLKSSKLKLKISLTSTVLQIIICSLHSNCMTVITKKAQDCSYEDIRLLGISCHGVHLFIKSKFSDELDLIFIESLSDKLIEFLYHGELFSRDSLILIIPLIIFMNIKFRGSSSRIEYQRGLKLFSQGENAPYLFSIWQNCVSKTCECAVSEKDLVMSSVEKCICELYCDKMVWFDYVFLDTIRTWLRKYPKLFCDDSGILNSIFSCTVLYYNAKEFNTEKVCEEIQHICLKLQPLLLQRVKILCQSPWYSRNTMHYQNILLCRTKNYSTIHQILEQTVSNLGYNRLDHCNIKVIKTLVNKHMTRNNFFDLLKTCVFSIRKKNSIARTMCLYIAPLFKKESLFPCDLKENLFFMLSAPSISDGELIFLFEVFYDSFKEDLKHLLETSQVINS